MNKHQANHHLGFSMIFFSSNWSWLAEPLTITRAKFCQCGQFVRHPMEQIQQSSSRSSRAIYLKWAVQSSVLSDQATSYHTPLKPSPTQPKPLEIQPQTVYISCAPTQLLYSYFDLMLLKFLPRERCRIDRFLANHTSRVDRSESRPGWREKRLEVKVRLTDLDLFLKLHVWNWSVDVCDNMHGSCHLTVVRDV